jgi:tetratricopeptide (TPR) repeat protein
MALRDRRLVNLLEFDKNAIRPAIKRLMDGSDHHLQDFAVSELLACSSWVRLGVGLDFFVMDDAINVLVRRFQGLSVELNEHESTADYLFNPDLYALRDRSAVGWQTFLEPLAFKNAPRRDLLRSFLRSAMVADISLTTNASAVRFFAYLARTPETIIRFLSESAPSSENSAISDAVLRKGCAAAMSYIEQQSALFGRFGTDVPEASRLDDGIYAQIRQVGSWRLRLSNTATRDAFVAACQFALESAGFRGSLVTRRLIESSAAWGELTLSDLSPDQALTLGHGPRLSFDLPSARLNEVTPPGFAFRSRLWAFSHTSPRDSTAFLERSGSSEELHAFVDAAQRRSIRASLGHQPDRQRLEILERLVRQYRLQLLADVGKPNIIRNQFALGALLLELAVLNHDYEALYQATHTLLDALAHPSWETSRREWLNAQINLGIAFRTYALRQGQAEYFVRAEGAFLQALEAAGADMLLEAADAQLHLGDLLLEIGERTREEGTLARAVAMFREASEIVTRDRLPLDWALLQHRLGVALSVLGYMRNDSRSLSYAAEAFRSALAVFSAERTPMYWAIAQHNLGGVLADLAQSEQDVGIIERALEAFREAYKLWPEGSRYSDEAQRAINGLLVILRFRRGKENE